jgi:hypothetical protein
MCPHTNMLLYICPHATLYVSSCYSVCVLMLLCMCPHATLYVSPCYSVCVPMLLCMCPHATLYVSSCYSVCVLILLGPRSIFDIQMFDISKIYRYIHLYHMYLTSRGPPTGCRSNALIKAL